MVLTAPSIFETSTRLILITYDMCQNANLRTSGQRCCRKDLWYQGGIEGQLTFRISSGFRWRRTKSSTLTTGIMNQRTNSGSQYKRASFNALLVGRCCLKGLISGSRQKARKKLCRKCEENLTTSKGRDFTATLSRQLDLWILTMAEEQNEMFWLVLVLIINVSCSGTYDATWSIDMEQRL